jgi:RNA polymerase sigma-70 factor (ECF subfamily)
MADAFQNMLVEHLPRMQAYAIMITRDRTVAADLLQQTALQALRGQHQFTPGTNFTAWLYKIMRNVHFSALRTLKRQMIDIDSIDEKYFGRSGGQEERVLTNEISRALDYISPDQREVLILICAGELSYAEAAEAIGCTVGTVKSRLWRARAKMEELIMGQKPSKADGDVKRIARRQKIAPVGSQVGVVSPL